MTLLGLPAPREPLARASSTRTTCTQRVREAEDGGADPARVRLRAPTARSTGARWSFRRDLGAHAAGRDRLARRPGARAAAREMLDDDEWAVDRRAAARRLRPRAVRHHAAGRCWPRAALPRGVERGGLRRRLGRRSRRGVGEWMRQGARPRALVGVPGVVHPPGTLMRATSPRASAASRRRRSSCSSRRRSPRLPRRGRRSRAAPAAQRRLAGRLLAVPQPARQARAARDPLRQVAGRPSAIGDARSRAPPAWRRPPVRWRIAAARVRQPGGDARHRRPRGAGCGSTRQSEHGLHEAYAASARRRVPFDNGCPDWGIVHRGAVMDEGGELDRQRGPLAEREHELLRR